MELSTTGLPAGAPVEGRWATERVVGAMRADAMLDKDDLDGVAVWKWILRAVEELQGTATGARVH